MYISEEKIIKQYCRTSKNGITHYYHRTITYIKLQCDNCTKIFLREKGQISSKRRNNKYYHCCPDCDTKRFAQHKGVEKRVIWNLPVSITITRYKL